MVKFDAIILSHNRSSDVTFLLILEKAFKYVLFFFSDTCCLQTLKVFFLGKYQHTISLHKMFPGTTRGYMYSFVSKLANLVTNISQDNCLFSILFWAL